MQPAPLHDGPDGRARWNTSATPPEKSTWRRLGSAISVSGSRQTALGIIFDSDLGNGIDDALALAMLYGFEGKTEARLVSNSTTRSSLRSAAFCEALARFFTPAPQAGGAFAGFQRPAPPIGMADNGKMPEDTPIIKAVLEKKNPDGKPVYSHTIEKLNDTADPLALIRNAMTAQADGNCAVVLAGPATNLVQLMSIPGAMDLIKRKVKVLALVDVRLKPDVPAARRLLAEWPSPIVAAGLEVGAALPFPAASIEKDFAWAPNHPIPDAYRAFQPMPYDAPAPAMAAMLYAVHPEGFLKLGDPGTITIAEDGKTQFAPSANGRHRYILPDPAQKEKVIQTYTEMASAKPTARPVRFRGPQKKDAAPAKAATPEKKQ